jgi:hypothetical protein
MQAADVLRYGLFLGCSAMFLITFFYLRQRRLFWWEFLLWGMLALCLPILGPFMVIASQPGKRAVHPAWRNARMQRRRG